MPQSELHLVDATFQKHSIGPNKDPKSMRMGCIGPWHFGMNKTDRYVPFFFELYGADGRYSSIISSETMNVQNLSVFHETTSYHLFHDKHPHILR